MAPKFFRSRKVDDQQRVGDSAQNNEPRRARRGPITPSSSQVAGQGAQAAQESTPDRIAALRTQAEESEPAEETPAEEVAESVATSADQVADNAPTPPEDPPSDTVQPEQRHAETATPVDDTTDPAAIGVSGDERASEGESKAEPKPAPETTAHTDADHSLPDEPRQDAPDVAETDVCAVADSQPDEAAEDSSVSSEAVAQSLADVTDAIGDEPSVVTQGASSSKDFFEPAADKVRKYGLDGLLQSKEQATSVERALSDLGTPVPVIRHVAEVARVTRGSWVASARDLGTPPGERLTRALSMATGYPFFPRYLVDDVDAASLQHDLPRGVHTGRYAGLPCARDGEDLLVVVPDTESIAQVRTSYYGTTNRLEFCIGSPSTIETLYRKKFGDTERPFDEALSGGDDPAEIIRRLLVHAAAVGASDIHLEPRKNHGVIYLRIDGVRETFRILPLFRTDQAMASGAVGGIFGQITNLIFHNSGQSDVEMTEEGEIDALIPDELQGRYDFRLQLSKSINGVRAVIRLLDQSGDVGEIEDLGIDDNTAEKLERVIHADSGLILFTGPTGSGKSTTQAALLKSVNAVQNSIQTIENPVETRSGMWVQHPLSRRGDRDEGSLQKELAKGLLRCDPEVIQVQELRDADNTMVAADAANTGHLVFATLHTNSAALSIVRLRSMRSPMTGEALDMSVIAPVLRGIMAQRLVRKVCRHCRVVDERPDTLRALDDSFGNHDTVYAASSRGCEACRFTGYSGRMSIYELLEVTRDVSDLILRNPTVSDLTDLLPFKERMLGRGYERVIAGKTTMDEVHRVVSEH